MKYLSVRVTNGAVDLLGGLVKPGGSVFDPLVSPSALAPGAPPPLAPGDGSVVSTSTSSSSSVSSSGSLPPSDSLAAAASGSRRLASFGGSGAGTALDGAGLP